MTSNFWDIEQRNLLKFKSYSDLVENLYMSAIVDSFQRLRNVDGITGLIENRIRNLLAYDLENKNDILFPYFEWKILKLTKENTLLLSPSSTNRTDIEFFISGYGDFVVECKNLKSAEQRYVADGINRFTSGNYSKDDSESGMIAFVVGGKIDKIKTGIISKVESDPTFMGVLENAGTKCAKYVHSFHTTHKRENSTLIYIHHLFLDLCC